MKLEDEKWENVQVLESISKPQDNRNIWRIANGILNGKTMLNAVPEMLIVINNLNSESKQFTDSMEALKQEEKMLWQ